MKRGSRSGNDDQKVETKKWREGDGKLFLFSIDSTQQLTGRTHTRPVPARSGGGGSEELALGDDWVGRGRKWASVPSAAANQWKIEIVGRRNA